MDPCGPMLPAQKFGKKNLIHLRCIACRLMLALDLSACTLPRSQCCKADCLRLRKMLRKICPKAFGLRFMLPRPRSLQDSLSAPCWECFMQRMPDLFAAIALPASLYALSGSLSISLLPIFYA